MLHERLITPAEATREFPRRRHISSVTRYLLKGVRGQKLESIVLGGRRYTSVEAIARFIAATTAVSNGERPASRTARQQTEAIERADQEVRKEGF
jgi:hypothetical protein